MDRLLAYPFPGVTRSRFQDSWDKRVQAQSVRRHSFAPTMHESASGKAVVTADF